jgi:molybdopterin synthase catalytic subunit
VSNGRNDINLDPQAAAQAARRLSECAAELLAARRTTGANLEAMGSVRPWGRDELGDIFTRRYEEVANRTLDTWRTSADRLHELGSRIDDATAATVETDRITSQVIDKVQ